VTLPASRLPDTLQAVLFDLDGTLADTAPDLAAAANKMRVARGLPPVPLETLRPLASAGARGLLGAAFDIGPNDAGYEAMRVEFIGNYETDLCTHSSLFDGIPSLLAELTARQVRWGIVTNKATRLTEPLVALLGIAADAGCIVCGDTTPHAKPHPAPLLHAAQTLRIEPAAIVYVGDDLRDVQAGRAAGMLTIAAAYGYCGDTLAPQAWGADQVAHSTAHLKAMLSDIAGTAAQGVETV
jgi:phosphoglycolate phosphatase